jgi:hypothetical protein
MSRRLSLIGLFILIALAAGGLGSRRASAQASPPAQRLPGHVLAILPQATRLAPAAQAGAQPVTITVVLNRSDQPGFDAFLAAVQNPTSVNF